MITFLITILCLNIDALSYGISKGLTQKFIPQKFIFFITITSTIMFAVPLGISKYIYNLFNPKILRLINAAVLFLLGLKYIFEKPKDNKQKKQDFFKVKSCLLESIIISIDAIFTAILSGFFGDFFIFYIFFYGLTNYFAIFFGNRFFYKIGNFSKINLSFFSGFIFIFLAILKVVGI